MPNRYRLKGASLEEIRSKAEAQYGPSARIVSAERVISPGIAGLFAGNRYEALVEVQPKHDVVTGEVVGPASSPALSVPRTQLMRFVRAVLPLTPSALSVISVLALLNWVAVAAPSEVPAAQPMHVSTLRESCEVA